MNALRNWRPSSLRTGMLCRFGWSLLSRPVRATVWLKVAWIRPSGATSAISPVAVRAAQLLHLAVLHQRIDELRPLVAQLLSSVAASVENPVLVFFCGANCFSVYSISRSCTGELKLNGRPTTRWSSAAEPLALRGRSLVQPPQLGRCRRRCRRAPSRPARRPTGSRSWRTARPCPASSSADCSAVRQVRDGERATAGDAPVVVALLGEVELSRRRRGGRRKLVRRVPAQQVGAARTRTSAGSMR